MGRDWLAVVNPVQYGLAQVGMGAETGMRGLGQNTLADRIWGKRGNVVQPDNFAENARLQREFAQNSIRWKVNDAKMAGIHPTYALGAQGTSFSPMYSAGSTDMGDDTGRLLAEVGCVMC